MSRADDAGNVVMTYTAAKGEASAVRAPYVRLAIPWHTSARADATKSTL